MSESRRRQHQLRTLSRFLRLLLVHRPARFPLAMDSEGYASLDKVMHILNALPNFRWATRADIDAVLTASGRQRFEIAEDDDGQARIRAIDGPASV